MMGACSEEDEEIDLLTAAAVEVVQVRLPRRVQQGKPTLES
jgi:hypothetical protein